MNAINNPNNLPICQGASSDSSQRGGDRPEQITVEGGPTRTAGNSATDRVETVEPAPIEQKIEQATPTPSASVLAEEVSTEEIEHLHVRFDRMETLLKRKLAVATLHGRFDALEAWLLSHFPN